MQPLGDTNIHNHENMTIKNHLIKTRMFRFVMTAKVDRSTIKVSVLGLWDSIDPRSNRFMNIDITLLHSMFFLGGF